MSPRFLVSPVPSPSPNASPVVHHRKPSLGTCPFFFSSSFFCIFFRTAYYQKKWLTRLVLLLSADITGSLFFSPIYKVDEDGPSQCSHQPVSSPCLCFFAILRKVQSCAEVKFANRPAGRLLRRACVRNSLAIFSSDHGREKGQTEGNCLEVYNIL